MKNRHTRLKFPIKTILITAILASGITAGILYLTGFHSSHGTPPPQGSQNLTGDKTTQLWTCGMHPWIIAKEPGLCPICNMDLVPKREDAPEDEAGGERKIVYWRAPMDPTEIYDQPGKSKMGMELVPVYEDEIIGGVDIKIDPVTRQNMGVRTAAAEKGPLHYTLRTYGHITYDETKTTQISPKVSGWFDKLHVNFTGEQVKKGQPLYEIYSPELVAAQEEYLTALRNVRTLGGGSELLASARRRLSYFDVAENEIRAIENARKVKKTMLIRSPFAGIVTHKNAVEGAYVKTGTTVYTIADLSTVWVEAHIYEYELSWIKEGQSADMTLPYLPGKDYQGKVSYIYPYLQQKTRDVVIRLEFPNPDLALKPDMYTDVRIHTGGDAEGIMIPAESVIRSGERNLIFVEKQAGKFSPREVMLGRTLDDSKIQILSGLAPGEKVVTSGQFLLDSESKLKEAVQKMMEAQSGGKREKKASASDDDFFSDMGSEKSGGDDDFFKDME